jgi:hypothetical protein
MYPSTPLGSLVSGHLARTGFSFATFLVVATVLLVTGLLLMRTARILHAHED